MFINEIQRPYEAEIKDLVYEGVLYAKYQFYADYPGLGGDNVVFLKIVKFRYPNDAWMSEDWLIKRISEKENAKISFCGYLNI